jgi:hypothetical protein
MMIEDWNSLMHDDLAEVNNIMWLWIDRSLETA